MNSSVETIKKSLLKLSRKYLQEFSDASFAVEDKISGDGRGLTSGFLIDRLINEFFATKLKKDYKEYHEGEADLKLSGEPVSFKKIKGKSEIALSWSKNPKYKKSGRKSIKRDFWKHPVLILNSETAQWWKNSPKKPIDKKLPWDLEIPRGFYIIDNKNASKLVKLDKNNKTNSLIKKQYVYKLLVQAQKADLFIPLPIPNKVKEWTLLDGVRKKGR